MKIIFMAAGIGSRLTRKYTERPKCLIEIEGETLISRAVRLFKEKGFNDIITIVGFSQNMIKETLGNKVRYVFNPFYSVTNSIASLWFARDIIKEDELIIINADLFFEDRLVDILLELDKPVTMLADTSRKEEADYRFGFDSSGLIKKFGKELNDEETDAEYVGIANIKKEWNNIFIKRMEEFIEAGKIDLWWEDVIYSFIPDGEKIYYKDIKDTFWLEIDYVEDYQRLINYSMRLKKFPNK